MPDLTLEEEFAAFVESMDYCVTVFAGDNYLKVRLIYLPKLSVKGEGALSYIANGVVAEQHFISGNPQRRWRKARKWAQAEIAGHREFIRTVQQA